MGNSSLLPPWVADKYGEAGVNAVVQGPGESRANLSYVQHCRIPNVYRPVCGWTDCCGGDPTGCWQPEDKAWMVKSAGLPWSEAELGRADEPEAVVRTAYTWACTPTAELAGNTGTTLGEFFFWGENVDADDDAPDYLAITRDVVGG